MDLLERAEETAELERSLSVALGRSGRLVLISGEAGIGKTAFVQGFCDQHGGALRIWRGSCDALFTPRPLGPFLDVADAAGGALTGVTAQGARPHQLADALRRELGLAPTILVLEDLHWADEATLDVVTMLSRRLDGLPALVIVTYRDDELPAAHPLRVVVGEFATNRSVDRVRLRPLSISAVAAMAGASDIDVDSLYRHTGGNPFFVTEVLAAPSEAIPLNVRDAVLARAARLDSGARALLDSVAVVPLGCEYWLLEALADVAHLDACLASGVLLAGPSTVSFRHELGRLAIEEQLPAVRRIRLHQRALEALLSAPSPDPARLAHHAVAAADSAAVARYAPEAGARASALGAHRGSPPSRPGLLAAPRRPAGGGDRRPPATTAGGSGTGAGTASEHAGQSGRTDSPRVGGSGPGLWGSAQPGDRRPTLRIPTHGRPSRGRRTPQARRGHERRSHSRSGPAGT